MYVVIFRAKVKQFDETYLKMAANLRDIALKEFGCLEFIALSQDENEIALSYWKDEASIKAWKQQTDHLMAQELGRTQWYESYSVEIVEVKRSYRSHKEH
jgi:heme-degrading monooxygenase HmoA